MFLLLIFLDLMAKGTLLPATWGFSSSIFSSSLQCNIKNDSSLKLIELLTFYQNLPLLNFFQEGLLLNFGFFLFLTLRASLLSANWIVIAIYSVDQDRDIWHADAWFTILFLNLDDRLQLLFDFGLILFRRILLLLSSSLCT